MVPTQSVFSVESSIRTSEVKESNEDIEFHRKGTSAICVQFAIYLKLMFLRWPLYIAFFRLIILSPSSVPVEVCPLLAVRDGEAEGWR